MKKANSIYDILSETKLRDKNLKEEYASRLVAYPRGSLMLRCVNGKTYCYFRYRDGKKVITKYAGTERELERLKQEIAVRDELQRQIKALDAEIARIEKMELVK